MLLPWLIILTVAVLVLGWILSAILNLLTQNYRVPTRHLISIGIPVALVITALVVGVVILTTRLGAPPPPSDAGPSSTPTPQPPAAARPLGWATRASQAFSQPDGPATGGLKDGCTTSSGHYENEQLVLRLDSCRDYTYQVGYEVQPARLDSPYYLAADVTFASGPEDGYCTLLFNWQDSEHWFAFKLGRDKLEITWNKGGLPHSALDGPRAHPAVRPHEPNRLAVWLEERDASFYINGLKVSDQEIRPNGGETRLGVQAANRSDVVRCTFDNVELLTPS